MVSVPNQQQDGHHLLPWVVLQQRVRRDEAVLGRHPVAPPLRVGRGHGVLLYPELLAAEVHGAAEQLAADTNINIDQMKETRA